MKVEGRAHSSQKMDLRIPGEIAGELFLLRCTDTNPDDICTRLIDQPCDLFIVILVCLFKWRTVGAANIRISNFFKTASFQFFRYSVRTPSCATTSHMPYSHRSRASHTLGEALAPVDSLHLLCSLQLSYPHARHTIR